MPEGAVGPCHHSQRGSRCGIERLESRDLLAVGIERTSLNLRFSADLRPNESAYGEYQSFKISNDGVPLSDVWVRATNFSPTQKVQLGAAEDGLFYLGDLGSGSANAETAFIYMVAERLTSPVVIDPQAFTVEVWQGVPGGATSALLQTLGDAFEWVGEASRENSSSVTSSVTVGYEYGGLPTALPIVGGTMTMTVTGSVKNKPDRILFSPATTLAWPADAFELRHAVVTYSRNPQLPPDVIFEKPIPPESTPKTFTAVYTFRVAAPTSVSTPVTPMQYTANGIQSPTNRKFEVSPLLEGVAPIPPAVEATDLVITKTGTTTVVAGSATIASYEISVTSTGAYAAQGVVVSDLWPAAFTRLPISPPPPTTVAATSTGFTWTIGTLAAGASLRLLVQFTVPAGTPTGPYVNSATITSTTPDPGSRTATISTTVTAAPVVADLQIEKRDFVQEYVPGETLTWRITVTNNGPAAVAGARVLDTFPEQVNVAGVTWTAMFSGGGTASGSGNIDELIGLSAGGTAVYTVSAPTLPTATGSLVNAATVSVPAGVTDPNPANNTWTDVDLFAPRADLAIVKSDAAATYVPGEVTTYTLLVTNAGPSFAAGATVVDTFATAFEAVSWSATFTGTDSSGVASGSGAIAQAINLAIGGTATYIVTARTRSTASGEITNTATVQPALGTTDPDPSNNSSSDTNTAAPEVFLVIAKTDDAGTYTPGLPITYMVTVSNTTGPSFLRGGRLLDNLPVTIVGGTWTASYTGEGSGGDASGSGVIDAGFDLSVGGTATFTISGTVAAAASGPLVNSATVTVPVGTVNRNQSQNTATDTDEPLPLADLRVAKTDNTTQYVPGATQTYVLTVSNFGPSDVRGAVLTDTFDPALIDVAAVRWTATFQDGSTRSGMGNITETFDIARGNAESVVTFTVEAPVLTGASGLLTNTATIAVPAGTTDPNLSNNVSIDVDAATPYADLQIVKRDFVQKYTPGLPLVYTVTVTNAGTFAVSGMLVEDAFDPDFFAVPAVLWTVVYSEGGTASGTGDIAEAITLGAGGTATFTVTAPTLTTAAGELINTATVTPPPGIDDFNLSNNVWTDVDLPDPVADIVVTKNDVGSSYVPGEVTRYTVIVRNDGPSAVIDATGTTGVRVVDTFAAQFNAVSWTAIYTGTGSSGPAAGEGAIDHLVSLAAGGTAIYTIDALVSPWATVAIANSATATVPAGTRDPNLTNNTDTDVNTAAPQVFLEIVKTDASDTYVPGESLTYTITLRNIGPSALVGGTVSDELPTELRDVAWTAVYEGEGSDGPAIGVGNLAVTPILLAVNGRATFTVTAFVPSIRRGDLVNTAAVSVPAGTTNTNPVTASTHVDTMRPVADLRSFKTDGSGGYYPGTTVTYTITVSNFGPSAALDASVTDTFDPAMFDVGAVRWTMVFPDGGTRSGSGDIAETFGLDRGNAERVITITVQAPVRATATVLISNTSLVLPAADTDDYNLTNNRSIDTNVEQSRNGLVTGSDDGCPSAPLVRVLDAATGVAQAVFPAYESGFRGGVRVAVADLNGDGYDEVITAPGRGRVGEIRVWTQAGLRLDAYTLLPFGSRYVGGVEVAVGDFDGDGRPDIAAAMSAGRGLVNVFRGGGTVQQPCATIWRSFLPFPGRYRGGVNLAAGDFGSFFAGRRVAATQDRHDELVVGSNAGMRATVRVYDLSTGPRMISSFQPIGSRFSGGVTLSIGPWDAAATPDILVGSGIGGRSVVEVYSGLTFTRRARLEAFSSFVKPNAKVYATSIDADGDGVIDRLFAVQGQQGIGGTRGVTRWRRSTGATMVLPGSVDFPPPLRITVMTKRRLETGLPAGLEAEVQPV